MQDGTFGNPNMKNKIRLGLVSVKLPFRTYKKDITWVVGFITYVPVYTHYTVPTCQFNM